MCRTVLLFVLMFVISCVSTCYFCGMLSILNLESYFDKNDNLMLQKELLYWWVLFVGQNVMVFEVSHYTGRARRTNGRGTLRIKKFKQSCGTRSHSYHSYKDTFLKQKHWDSSIGEPPFGEKISKLQFPTTQSKPNLSMAPPAERPTYLTRLVLLNWKSKQSLV